VYTPAELGKGVFHADARINGRYHHGIPAQGIAIALRTLRRIQENLMASAAGEQADGPASCVVHRSAACYLWPLVR